MASTSPIAPSTSGTLAPLGPVLNVGLIPVALFGVLSFAAATGLLLLLTWRIFRWNRKSRHVNQFVFLIYNLLLADIQQSMAFLLNARWLANDAILVGTSTCWAQGWFVSTGDMGSGVWAFAIGLHTFATVIFGYRLSNWTFAFAVVFCWCFIYGLAIAGVALHPDLYVRAVSWCWVNAKYNGVRLWLHYFWIFVFEFGTVMVYSTMILALRYRIQTNFYRSPDRTRHAQDAARLMVAYPTIYIFCTLPLATLRVFSLANPDVHMSGGWFCFAGAMITSNGWMDVLLYTMTRRITLFSDEPPPTDNGIESFFVPWKKDSFGTETTCEYVPDPLSPTDARHHGYQTQKDSPTGSTYEAGSQELVYIKDKPYRQRGTNDLLGFVSITEKKTVEVRSEPMTSSDRRAVKNMKDGVVSLDGGSGSRHGRDNDSRQRGDSINGKRSGSRSRSGKEGKRTESRQRGERKRREDIIKHDVSDESSMRQLWVGGHHDNSREDFNIRSPEAPSGRTAATTPISERSIVEAYDLESLHFRSGRSGI